MLVSALIQCHFDYACSYWFNSITQNTKTKLIRAQNKAIRFVLGKQYRDSLSLEDYKQAGYLPLTSRVNTLMLGHMYKISISAAPKYMVDNFELISHQHNTKKSYKNYVIGSYKTSGQQTFKYNGTCLWRDLPKVLKDSTSFQCFKKQVKKHMWEIAHKKVDCEFIY